MGKHEKSHGAKAFDNSQDAQTSIQKLIQNDGAFLPSGLQMIKNLRAVTNGQNPNAIQSVGIGNFEQALQALAKLFPKKSGSSQSNTDPCSIPEDQRTPQQQSDCEIQQSLQRAKDLAANNVPIS